MPFAGRAGAGTLRAIRIGRPRLTEGIEGTTLHPRKLIALAALVLAATVAADGQTQLFTGVKNFAVARLHPAIDYDRRPSTDPIAQLNARLASGEVTLERDGLGGYLESTLEALDIPVESQVLVFSKTSFQAPLIGPDNPRALYFNEEVSLGWVRGGPVLELAALDPEQGYYFYTLEQEGGEVPQFERNEACLSCHISGGTMDVPGLFAGSLFPDPTGLPLYAQVFFPDHRSPLWQRWGGWYVTGTHGDMEHHGNAVVEGMHDLASIVDPAGQNLTSLEGRFDPAGYPSAHSDLVALMVLEHQMHMTNLITRIGWEYRIDSPEGRALVASTRVPEFGMAADARDLDVRPLDEAVVDLVDYMLFVDEHRLTNPVIGTAGYAARFSAQGPFDDQGRSLRQLDLQTRLLRYPMSYMVYSDAFDAMPAPVLEAVYARLWAVLSGQVTGRPYDGLARDDRRAIVEILRATKPGLPAYFAQPVG